MGIADAEPLIKTSLWSLRGKSRLSRLWTEARAWRFGVFVCAFSAFAVFNLNLGLTLWAVSHYGRGGSDGRQTLWLGDCGKATRINTWLHVGINVLSTILLGASNYCMQCLSAPTRNEVDRAHAKETWLHIGIPSLRNLRRISKKRAFMWWLLALSSIPLHLFYNAIIFPTDISTTYSIVEVSDAFVQTNDAGNFTSSLQYYKKYNTTYFPNELNTNQDPPAAAIAADTEARRLRTLSAAGNLTRLSNKDCINTYAVRYQKRGSVLLVTTNSSDAIVYQQRQTTSSNWVCQNAPREEDFLRVRDVSTASWGNTSNCEISDEIITIRNHTSTWAPFRHQVSYCLSEQSLNTCKVQANLYITIIVICLNFFKAVVMLVYAFSTRETPLLTITDGVASFLERTDRFTSGMSLLSREDVEKLRVWKRTPKKLSDHRQRLTLGASDSFKVLCSLLIPNLMIMTALMLAGFSTIHDNYSEEASRHVFSIGLGQTSALTDVRVLVGNATPGSLGQLFTAVIVANAAQLVFSLVYFAYNGLMTAICGAVEWESYARGQSKPLRISGKLQGAQRSRYFLQLPYRFSVPLMAISALMHWLLSQAIFTSVVDPYNYDQARGLWEISASEPSYIGCNFSPIAMLCVSILNGLMLVFLWIFSFIRLKTNMPLTANCSAVIAAACHLPGDEDGLDMSLGKVQWGVVGADFDGIRHCAFSSAITVAPEHGTIYA